MALVEIRITKATLYIDEEELWKHLPKEIIAEGLRKGKAIKRSRERIRRESNDGNDDS